LLELILLANRIPGPIKIKMGYEAELRAYEMFR